MKVTEIRPGVSVYDLGQNASMMPRLQVHGAAGASGGSGDEDELICMAGIEAAGLRHA